MKPADQPAPPWQQARFVAVALIVGALTGVFGGLFHLAIDRIIDWPAWLAGQTEGWRLIAASAVITMAATVFAVFITRRFAPEASGSGVPEIEGAIAGIRHVHWERVLPVKFIAGIAAIGSGLVLGREGPTIHMGGSAALAASEMFRVRDVDRRALLAAGAGAGLACAFNAPMAAVLFVIEETRKQFPYSFRNYMGVFAAAITGTAVTQMISGARPDLPLSAGPTALASLPAFAVLGIILGAVGVLFNRCILAMLDIAAAWQKGAPYVWPALVGLLVGTLLILAPRTVTGGEQVISQIAVLTPSAGVLLMLAVVCYSVGTPGGIFAPILSLAACIGLAFGLLAQMMFPEVLSGIGVTPVSFGIVAMAALFSATVHAPAVGVVLVLELTTAYALVLPMLTACLTASLAAQWLGGRPIYEQMLERALAQAGRVPAKSPDNGPDIGLAADRDRARL
ncbi:MAG TPA: H(+)/Cl(-) exchange transporter ClcA [Methylobacterium sp.]|jgi:CIC family chloride channel protein|uniref:H(+)/Cl(-) exchange transporter ClcA n=1 Tax=Methylorubrum sp. B1-46 TaxID=2897334 RepID=UPI001E57F01D|nr:H(+)/Cl(-) exchange transporter ClcA [Methylorubrum sp. B1-46]UGB25134.1 H(+)/Cl(-) exchange transporter ClcA [Methylorubrum sp. B1-46]HEV2542701.1 H(+)/Cl(-) exchange transporter ClcA [Methylobacterium sp.]